MRKLVILLTAAVVAAFPHPAAKARRDADKPAAPPTPYELVVFEADGCVYCENFRTDALPLYRSSQLGRDAPVRFVNVSRSDETKMGLSSAITVAPTIVLFHEGREVDRIVGYPGPFNLMKLVNYMMGRGD